MARTRTHREDLTYAEAHRKALPELYGRIGHRLDMADRDWTEFCHWCKKPILLVEEVVDRGQNLYEKATTVTRKMAAMSSVPAIFLAPRIVRPREVQAEIDRLQARVSKLESEYPITHVTARLLYPTGGKNIVFPLHIWWEQVLMHHRNHHRVCRKAQARELPVRLRPLREAKERSELWTDAMDQLGLF